MDAAGMNITLWVGVALGADNRLHIKPAGDGTIAFFTVLTLLEVFAVVRVRGVWESPATFETFSPRALPVFLNFRRQGPAALISGALFIVLGWLIVLFPNDGWVVAPVLVLALATVTAFLVVICVWLFNRPRRLVPPELRDLPGLLTRSRVGTSPGTSVGDGEHP
jgi:hypothetical protein